MSRRKLTQADAIRLHQQLGSDQAVAERVGLSRDRVNAIRNGYSDPNPHRTADSIDDDLQARLQREAEQRQVATDLTALVHAAAPAMTGQPDIGGAKRDVIIANGVARTTLASGEVVVFHPRELPDGLSLNWTSVRGTPQVWVGDRHRLVHDVVWRSALALLDHELPDSLQIDHVHHDQLDLRLSTQRLVTPSQNYRNRRQRVGRTVGFRFVDNIQASMSLARDLVGDPTLKRAYATPEEAVDAVETWNTWLDAHLTSLVAATRQAA